MPSFAAPAPLPPSQSLAAFVKNIGTAANKTSGASISVSVPAAGVAAGNSIIVAFSMDPAAGPVVCSDPRNSYSVDADVTRGAGASGVRTVLCSAHNVAPLFGGDTVVVSHPLATAKAVSVTEFSGLAAPSPLDKTADATGFDANPSSGFTIPPTSQGEELLIGSIGVEGPVGDSFASGSGYTSLARRGTTGGVAATNITVNPEYRMVSATGAYEAGGSLGAARNWAAAIATYRSALAPTPTPTPTSTLTPTPTDTPTPTPTNTPTNSPTDTPSPTPTANPVNCIDDPRWDYFGFWSVLNSSLAFGGSLHRSNQREAFARVTFTKMTRSTAGFLSTKGPNEGIARIMLDGVMLGDFDLFNPTLAYQQAVFSVPVDAGEHVLEVRVTGRKNPSSLNTFVSVDAQCNDLEGPTATPTPIGPSPVPPSPAPPTATSTPSGPVPTATPSLAPSPSAPPTATVAPSVCVGAPEAESPSVLKFGAWATLSSPAFSGGQAVATRQANDKLRVTLVGSRITVCFSRVPNGGFFEVLIDGALAGTVNTFNPFQLNQQSLVFETSDGAHLVELRNTGGIPSGSLGSLTIIDGFRATGQGPSTAPVAGSRLGGGASGREGAPETPWLDWAPDLLGRVVARLRG